MTDKQRQRNRKRVITVWAIDQVTKIWTLRGGVGRDDDDYCYEQQGLENAKQKSSKLSDIPVVCGSVSENRAWETSKKEKQQ